MEKAPVSKIYRRLYGLQLNLCIRTENPFTFKTHSRCVQNIRQNIRSLADLSAPDEFHLWSFTISFKACSMCPCRGKPKKSEQEENSTLFPRIVISHHSSISKRMKQSGGLLSHAQWPTRLKLDRFFFSFIDILHGFSILLSYFQDTKCFALNRAHFFEVPLFASSSRQYLRRSGY